MLLKQNPLVEIRTTSELKSGDEIRLNKRGHLGRGDRGACGGIRKRDGSGFGVKAQTNLPSMVPNVEHPTVSLDTSQFNAYENIEEMIQEVIGKRDAFDASDAKPGEVREINGKWFKCVVMPISVGNDEYETKKRWHLANWRAVAKFRRQNIEEAKSRRFRATIYIDVFVPETDVIEDDHEIATKKVEEYLQQIPNSYIGSVDWYKPHNINPFN
jgi:hypothetical protein